ncbi:hypothetical protein GOBAR_AA04891 [Gossypium barbadense]|uniref:Uncharacterized protein n=1 Tax=Gossypium barbadense TaxID=3634 RepID=A0A2P5YJA5_GOSBA|nr:hypothetical protein GOBAR_AA04891 [Gossypium barbadense]
MADQRLLVILASCRQHICRPWHKGHDDLTSSSPSSGLAPAYHRQSTQGSKLNGELANAYSLDIVIASSLGKVHYLWAFYLHVALLRQAFAHCEKFPTTASHKSLGRVLVPEWLITLLDLLLIIALESSYALLTHSPLEIPLYIRLACVKHVASVHPEPAIPTPSRQSHEPLIHSYSITMGARKNRKNHIGFRDNQARIDDFHHVKVTLYS